MSYRINKYEPDKFERIDKGLSNDYVEFKFDNNILKIKWIQSDGYGSEMMLNLIDYLGAIPSEIHGCLSTAQAHQDKGWRRSIHFYCKLGLKIQDKYNLSGYTFTLYDDVPSRNVVFTATDGEDISDDIIEQYINKHTEDVNYDGFFVISLFDQYQSFDNSES